MNIRNHIILLLSIPILSSSESHECSVNEYGVTGSGSVCCRISKEYGLTSCKNGPDPRKVIMAFEMPLIRTSVKTLDDIIERAAIRGRYGVLAADASYQDGGNKVSSCETVSHPYFYGLTLHHLPSTV